MNWNTVFLLATGLSAVEAIRFNLQLEARPRFDKALSARQTGLVGDGKIESISAGIDFATSVQVGNQNLTLLVDTGSSDLYGNLIIEAYPC